MNTKTLLTVSLIVLTTSCSTNNRKITNLEKKITLLEAQQKKLRESLNDTLEKRIANVESQQEKSSMAIRHLTDNVFNGESVTIKGITYYPKPKIFETNEYKVYYRKKEKEFLLDAIVFSKTKKTEIICDSVKIEGNSISLKNPKLTYREN